MQKPNLLKLFIGQTVLVVVLLIAVGLLLRGGQEKGGNANPQTDC